MNDYKISISNKTNVICTPTNISLVWIRLDWLIRKQIIQNKQKTEHFIFSLESLTNEVHAADDDNYYQLLLVTTNSGS